MQCGTHGLAETPLRCAVPVAAPPSAIPDEVHVATFDQVSGGLVLPPEQNHGDWQENPAPSNSDPDAGPGRRGKNSGINLRKVSACVCRKFNPSGLHTDGVPPDNPGILLTELADAVVAGLCLLYRIDSITAAHS